MQSVEIFALKAGECGPFVRFTFPAYRHILGSENSKKVALGLRIDQEPAGLALASFSVDRPRQAQLLSVMVTGTERRKGAGRRLLEALSEELARRGCSCVTGEVTGSEERSLALERLLSASGWQFSGPTSVLCHAAQSRILQAPWLADATLPEAMQIFPWAELSIQERNEMLERHARESWIPESLSPFWNEDQIAKCSVGMRYRGRVAGWCVAYPFDLDTLRWWRLFVEKELQPLARSVPLLAETIRRAPDYGFHYGLWSVRADNRKMIRLLDRRMRGWLISAKPVWRVTKELRQG